MTNRKHKISIKHKIINSNIILNRVNSSFRDKLLHRFLNLVICLFQETYLKHKAQKVENEGIGKKIPKTEKLMV